jgi:hypothetical protein
MWYESPEYFLVVLALYVVACALDVWSSKKTSWYYGIYEGNKFARDKDGEFDEHKNLEFKAGLLGISVAIGILSHSWGAGCALLIASAVYLPIAAYLNFAKAKKGRKQQQAVIDVMRTGGQVSMTFVAQNGKYFAQLFHWLWVPVTSDPAADEQAAIDKVQAFAQSGAAFPG